MLESIDETNGVAFLLITEKDPHSPGFWRSFRLILEKLRQMEHIHSVIFSVDKLETFQSNDIGEIDYALNFFGRHNFQVHLVTAEAAIKNPYGPPNNTSQAVGLIIEQPRYQSVIRHRHLSDAIVAAYPNPTKNAET